MNADLKKFENLMKNDAEFQEKFQAYLSNCSDEQIDEKTVFEKVMIPLGKEYGLSATYEEYMAYIEDISHISQNDAELSQEELAQVSGGGKGAGAGLMLCYKHGIGVGSVGDDDGICALYGMGGTGICVGQGIATDDNSQF